MHRFLVVSRSIDFNSKTIDKLGRHLRYVYLQDINLKSIPSYLFNNAPNMEWLDVRNNKLLDLPEEIRTHRRLKVLPA